MFMCAFNCIAWELRWFLRRHPTFLFHLRTLQTHSLVQWHSQYQWQYILFQPENRFSIFIRFPFLSWQFTIHKSFIFMVKFTHILVVVVAFLLLSTMCTKMLSNWRRLSWGKIIISFRLQWFTRSTLLFSHSLHISRWNVDIFWPTSFSMAWKKM